MLMGRSISSLSKSVILVAPPNMIFLIIKGLDHLGFIFPLGSKVLSLSTFRTKSPSLRFLGFTFLLNALAILFWYPYAWYYVLALFSSIKANCSYLALAQSSFRTLVSIDTAFCPPSICVLDLEKSRYIIFSPWGHEDI